MADDSDNVFVKDRLASSYAWDSTVANYSIISPITTWYATKSWEVIAKQEDNDNDNDIKNVRVLDIACGTGALAIQAAQATQEKGGYVLATDFSPKMVEATQNVINQLKLSNIEARVENGQDLHVEDNSFDYAFSIFGLIFFPDYKKGLSEIFRVLKPGGKFAITVWTPATTWMDINGDILKRYGKTIDVYPFFNLSNPDYVTKLVTEIGFTEAKAEEVKTETQMSDMKGFVEGTRSNPGFTCVRDVISDPKYSSSQEAFEQLIHEVLQARFPTSPATFRFSALIVSGTKPERE